MIIQQLMKSIIDKSPSHYMIWFGDEQGILDVYIEKLIELKYNLVIYDTVSSALNSMNKPSFDTYLKIYEVIDDLDYVKAEKSWDKVQEKALKSKHILLLRYNKLNKSSKFYKQNNKYITEFENMNSSILSNYVIQALPELTQTDAERLCNICNNKYGQIRLEIDKIKQYESLYPCSDKLVLNKLIQDNIIVSEVGDISFKLVDCILYGDIKNSIDLVYKAKQSDISALLIISLLYKGFRNMLSYQLLKDKTNVDTKTGMSYWEIKQCKKLCGAYSPKEILNNIERCQNVEQNIKSGLIEDNKALDYLIIMCLN